jgi:hypothetical protein
MKKFALFLLLGAASFSCSTDEENIIMSDKATKSLLQCTIVSGSGGLNAEAEAAVTAPIDGNVLFKWDLAARSVGDRTYSSSIQIRNVDCEGILVTSSTPIDVFNTFSKTITNGSQDLASRCFDWRIVVKGYAAGTLVCETNTPWYNYQP